MASNVEILFFGRPEGLEVSSSVLMEGYLDSLYPEQGITETTDGLVWRVQFFNFGNTQRQVISCFRAMGSPARGAGGFIGVAAVFAGQFRLDETFAAHLESELSRFVNAVTNGVQFVSSRMEGWPVPQPYPHTMQLRSSLYPAVGGTPSFIGYNLDASRKVDQIEHSLGVNLPQGATTAHFMSSYSGDRTDAVDLNARVDSSDFKISTPPPLGNLELELEISELKKNLEQSQSELVQAKELLLAETKHKESIQRELDDTRREVDKLRRASKPKDAPRLGLWVLLGVMLGAAGVYFTLATPLWKKEPDIIVETRSNGVEIERQEVEKKEFDPIEMLRNGQALTPEKMSEQGVFEAVVQLADFPHEWMTSDLLDARYESIFNSLKAIEADFNESKFCETCLRFNVPYIQNSEYKWSVLHKFESEDPQVRKWLNAIAKHAAENPLFNVGEEWTVYRDEEQPLASEGGSFDASNAGKLCDEANLPGEMGNGLKADLCWEINRYAFDAPTDGQKFFTKWRLTPRD